MSKQAVILEHAGVAHGGVHSLHDITFRLAHGEFAGMIGPNGAGKTTLLTLINGLRRLGEGTVCVLGENPHRWGAYRLRRRIGYLPQAPVLDPRLPITVLETVLTGAAGRLGWGRRAGRAERMRAEAALDEVGMLGLRDRPLGQLSGGECQRVAIARVLTQSPALYLFDEPTASLDPQAQEEILALIQRLHRERGFSALYVTHDLDGLPEVCARLLLLKEGRIWREGGRREMLQQEVLRELYNGEMARRRIWGAA